MDTSRTEPGRPESLETVLDEAIMTEISARDGHIRAARESDRRAKDMVDLRARFQAAKRRRKAGVA